MMNFEKPTFEQNQEEKVSLNEHGKEALKDLILTLEAKRILDDEKQSYIDRFVSKINGETDEDIIDMVMANILLDALKAKELREKKNEHSDKVGFCAKCGASIRSNYNFCGQCGNKLK